jgi:hypothetical protein
MQQHEAAEAAAREQAQHAQDRSVASAYPSPVVTNTYCLPQPHDTNVRPAEIRCTCCR